ncbi:MAG: hypothetical protein NTX25_01940 [Proteobacteria bacterium]|nr:hypothetical protein [Pseudomonadota bacterium]
MDCYIHQSYGRLRIRKASLRGDRVSIEVLGEALSELNGAERIVINDARGTIVIHYDPQKLNSAKIFCIFQKYGVLPNVIGFPLSNLKQRQQSIQSGPNVENWISDSLDRATRIIAKALIEAALRRSSRMLLRKILL